MKRWGTWIAAVATVVFAGTAIAGEEKKLDIEKVPQAVRDAAKKAAPQVKFTKAAIEIEEGDVVYELAGRCPQGRQCEIDVTAGGKVLEIETECRKDDIPSEVTRVLKKRMPNFRAKFVEKSVRPYSSTWYEFEGSESDGAQVDVEIRDDGRLVLIEEDDDTDARVGE